jgi:hypothetical protein
MTADSNLADAQRANRERREAREIAVLETANKIMAETGCDFSAAFAEAQKTAGPGTIRPWRAQS